MTNSEFYERMGEMLRRQNDRKMEEYLLALYLLVLENKDRQPSLELFLELFEKAFTSEPWKFDASWLSITENPSGNENEPGVSYTLETIRFQVAEFHRMEGKESENEYRYLGITSETGNTWYNFDVFTYLECASRCVASDNSRRVITWNFLGDILDMGRSYE